MIVAISEKHKAHFIESGKIAICGQTSDMWQLHFEASDVKPNLCKQCNKRLFGSGKETQPVDSGPAVQEVGD